MIPITLNVLVSLSIEGLIAYTSPLNEALFIDGRVARKNCFLYILLTYISGI